MFSEYNVAAYSKKVLRVGLARTFVRELLQELGFRRNLAGIDAHVNQTATLARYYVLLMQHPLIEHATLASLLL